MQVPITDMKIIDLSNTPSIEQAEPSIPKCLMLITSDKGPEELKYIYGSQFYKSYGNNISFEKYGQPLLQASRIIEAGGSLYVKRVVASNSTLANMGLFLGIKPIQIQATNGKGQLIYTDPDGNETTDNAVGNTAKMITVCQLKWTMQKCTGGKTIDDIDNQFESVTKEDDTNKEYLYHIYTLTDIGRGKSSKKIKFAPDSTTNKSTSYANYIYQEIEGDEVIETANFTFDPDIIRLNENKSLKNVISLHSSQLKCLENDTNIQKALDKISEISNLTVDTLKTYDILFAQDLKGNGLDEITLNLEDEDAINLSIPYGLALQGGENGDFGDYPVTSSTYETEMAEYITDDRSHPELWDLDNYKIDLIIDANYPNKVKRGLESLASWRDDCEYLEDGGLGLRNLEDILASKQSVYKHRTIGWYPIFYDVINPITKKQITVTIGYSLATLMVNHFINGRTRPMAGELYQFTIPEAIAGTLNFTPRKTPSYNEKEECVDNRINYVGYYDDLLTVETLMSTQDTETQLSYINNCLAIQEIIKAVRTRCPKIRYSFITGDDLNKYEDDVNAVLNNYAGNFKTLKMVYANDSKYADNKVFYAYIVVVFKNFVQKEYFELYTLNDESDFTLG